MTYSLYFAPCTGFGDAGRSCVIRQEGGRDCVGYGETEEEAVLEALMDGGLSFDAAFDRVGETLRSAEFIERR